MKVLQRRDQVVDHLLGAGDMHRRRVGVVRRLAHIAVVVGMDRRLRPHLAAEDFDRPVRDHFIGVHVRLRAGPGLPDNEGKVIVELAGDHLIRRLDDGLADLRIKASERHVGFGRGTLDDPERTHHRPRLLFPADLEIAEGTLGLRAPIAVGGNLDRAKCVGFGAGLGHRGLQRRWWRLKTMPTAIRQASIVATVAMSRAGNVWPDGPAGQLFLRKASSDTTVAPSSVSASASSSASASGSGPS